MNLTSVSLNLAAITIPEAKADNSKEYVLWGANHGFMKEVLGYQRKSPTASAMFARKAAFIAGEGFNVGEGNDALKKWLDNVAGDPAKTGLKPMSGNQLLKRVSLDASHLEGVAIQVGWAKDGKTLAFLKPQRIETVACAKLNDKDQIEGYHISRDWSKLNEFAPQYLPAYNPAKAKNEPVQLWVYFPEAPGQDYYTALSFASALPYMQAEARLATHHDNNIRTGFRLAAVIKIRKGPEDKITENADGTQTTVTAAQQRTTFQEAFKSNFTGESGESVLFLWGDSEGNEEDAGKMADVEALSLATGETYETVAGLCQQAILSAGQVTSPVVVGLPGEGGLGGNGSEIREAYDMYNSTVCRPWQVVLLDFFRDVAQYAPGVGKLVEDADAPALEIISSMPVKMRFDADTYASVMEDDEIRNTGDLAPRKKPEGEGDTPPQTEAQKELSASVGGQTAIDSMLTALAQNLTTRESCIARLKTFFGLTTEQAEEIVPKPATEGGTTATVAPGTI